MKETESEKGFTIIEVALVLAIAGLIFIAAFIALPALQRTQRDAKRRDDVGVLLTALQRFQTNNRGALPSGSTGSSGIKWGPEVEAVGDNDTTWLGFYRAFLGNNFEDPDYFTYTIKAGDCGVTTGSECIFAKEPNDPDVSFKDLNYTMYIVKGAACDGSKAVAAGNPRRVAVLYKLESNNAYCINSQ